MEKKFNIPNTDLYVSPMGMGTVDAGVAWGRDAASADSMFGTFIEAGGNLIDCAHVYSDVIGLQQFQRAFQIAAHVSLGAAVEMQIVVR